MKRLLSLDFDGVINTYSSGWKGPSYLPDPPVPGALEWMMAALEDFDVAIFSSRSRYWGGRRAMKRWLYRHTIDQINRILDERERSGLTTAQYMDDPRYRWLEHYLDWGAPLDTCVRDAAWAFVNRIQWPTYKPPAKVGLDDRIFRFDGNWPDLKTFQDFQPWNKSDEQFHTRSDFYRNLANGYRRESQSLRRILKAAVSDEGLIFYDRVNHLVYTPEEALNQGTNVLGMMSGTTEQIRHYLKEAREDGDLEEADYALLLNILLAIEQKQEGGTSE